MINLNIHIIGFNDPPPTPRKPGQELIEVKAPIDVSILQGGMGSGKPSVGIGFDLPDGRRVFIETSYALWDMASGAFRGAIERWHDEAKRKEM